MQETIWSYSARVDTDVKKETRPTSYFVTKRRRCSLEEKTMYTHRLSMRREHLIILRYAIILMKGPDATHIRRIIFGHSEPRGGYRPPVFFSAASSVRSRLCYKVFHWLKYGQIHCFERKIFKCFSFINENILISIHPKYLFI